MRAKKPSFAKKIDVTLNRIGARCYGGGSIPIDIQGNIIDAYLDNEESKHNESACRVCISNGKEWFSCGD